MSHGAEVLEGANTASQSYCAPATAVEAPSRPLFLIVAKSERSVGDGQHGSAWGVGGRHLRSFVRELTH